MSTLAEKFMAGVGIIIGLVCIAATGGLFWAGYKIGQHFGVW